MNEIWRLSATELAAKIRARELSARDAAQAALARLEAVNPAINAVVAHDPEDVLAQADGIDAALARGEEPGILAGVPVTVKVNIDQTGYATTNGTRLQAELIAKQNSPVVDNLRRAGAVILGRTNTPAFSLRWFTSNLLHGVTRNPRDPALTPGGSSGGAAAALAAGIGHLAHGTDIAGSIRYPAYACGVHGLRPSLGRVPAYNPSSPERPIGPQLTAVSGPLARSIADLRAGLAALAGPDARDPWVVPAPLTGPEFPHRAALVRRPGGLAIAPEVDAALSDAAARLRDAGWQVTELADVPDMNEMAELQARLWLGDGFAAAWDAAERDGDPGARATLAGLKSVVGDAGPAEVLHALTRRAAILRDWLALLAREVALILPVSAELPFANDLDLADFQRTWRAQLTQIGLALTGLPALVVSTGLVGKTPVGVQLVAGRFREDICLAAAEAIERAGTPAAPVDP
ncbi:MAG: amidase [Rhodospirillales bacterium 20-64-7]|nr:MAG: amidase [Rhodospirillales bacterium 20-64-7]